MENPLDLIAEALDALIAAGGDRDAPSLTTAELVAVNQAFGVLRRRVDAAFAPVAAEISRKSRGELGGDSLARRQGFRSPVAFISTTTGASVGETVKLVQVGEATAPRASLSGEVLPARHPQVAAAVASGRLAVTAASATITLLDRVAPRVDAARLALAEGELAELAPGMRPDELARLLARAEAHLDPDGIEPRHDDRRAERSLVIHERDGMLHLTGRLTSKREHRSRRPSRASSRVRCDATSAPMTAPGTNVRFASCRPTRSPTSLAMRWGATVPRHHRRRRS